MLPFLSRRDCRRRPACGFTLVELLVVIAIIGLLAAIIIPVAGTVRRTAKVTRCIANHRQISTACLLYLNDNKGRLYYLKGATPLNGSGVMAGDQASANTPGYLCKLLEPYGLVRAKWIAWGTPVPNRAQTVWYCPVSNETKYGELSDRGCTYYYHYLGQHIGITTDTPAVNLDQVAGFMSTQPFMQDYYGSHQNASIAVVPVWGSGGATTNKGVYSFLDGHVSYRVKP
ncbi:MAG: prepilin-type N-terminal cleavage/methylation domain-containing protein [Opitutaceae bacterium]|jgi:prepilin-type N-terminal cleavage/methylation domain-containing protein|nr:prepilin-type N-terminal cleavage/methylation domain-containing protein [Opitutaceae bacterium]